MSKKIGVMRSLGQAFGIVIKAIRTPVQFGRVEEVARSTHTKEQGEVTLRRTVIDEIIWTDCAPAQHGADDSQQRQTV